MKSLSRNCRGASRFGFALLILSSVCPFAFVAPSIGNAHENELGLAGEVGGNDTSADSPVKIEGENRRWHKLTLTLDGPFCSENLRLNPFLDYRMDVAFKHAESGTTYIVPGYFAADGDAANTSAIEGNKWRAHLAPDQIGEWSYEISFRSGRQVAISEDPKSGEPITDIDGLTGTFEILETNKTGRDFRAHGRLDYVGKHHLQFAGTGEFFLKAGADAPENLLAYEDFDGDFKTDGHKDNLVKNWAPHIQDWQVDDPTWQDGKGKGLVGAINYLASQGLNAFSFLTLNIDGDDRNVFPYLDYDERYRIDCSKMDQWEIIFEHGTKLGMHLHFKTQEAENVNLLDDGFLGPQRRLYYRELIARFSHHLALNWNLGEEVGLGFDVPTSKKQAWAAYFWKHDPYQHPIVIHNGDNHFDLLGDKSELTGFSLQTHQPDFSRVHAQTKEYIRRSAEAGKPWVVACDEPGDATHSLVTDAEDPTRDDARQNALWGHLMAGGAGVEWYFGYQHPHSDLTCQDYRVREKMWQQSRFAINFFTDNEIPFWDMKNADRLLTNKRDYCLRKEGEVYLVYCKSAEAAGKLDLSEVEGPFEIHWYNPRTGGELQSGSVAVVNGGASVALGIPKSEQDRDWLAVLRRGDPDRDYPPSVTFDIETRNMLKKDETSFSLSLKAQVKDDRTAGDKLKLYWRLVDGPASVIFEDANSLSTTGELRKPGIYEFALIAHDGTQAVTAPISVELVPFQAITNKAITASRSCYFENGRRLENQYLKVEGERRQALVEFDLTGIAAEEFAGNLRLHENGDSGKGILRIYQVAEFSGAAQLSKSELSAWDKRLVATESVAISNGEAIDVKLNGLRVVNGNCVLWLTLDAGGNDIWFGAAKSEKSPQLILGVGSKNLASGSSDSRKQSGASSRQDESEFTFEYDPKNAKQVHVQQDGIIVVEAEAFDKSDREFHRKWYLSTVDQTPNVKPDPDPSHAADAVGGAYLELLPDTRRTHQDPLEHGISFAPRGGQCSVLYYPIEFKEAGRYYVWVRICCTGSEDNGLHVGLDGEWPESGQRMQWTGKHGEWQWDSRQRTEKVHTGVLGQIWLDVAEPGLHTVMFSMREDGFEFDRFLLTKEKEALPSKSTEAGPKSSPTR